MDESDRRIMKVLKELPKFKHNPASMAKLYSYRTNVVNNLTRSLAMLVLDKQKIAPKTLEELFAEDNAAVNTNSVNTNERSSEADESE